MMIFSFGTEFEDMISLSDSREDITKRIEKVFGNRDDITIHYTKHSVIAELKEFDNVEAAHGATTVLAATFDDEDKCLMLNFVRMDIAGLSGFMIDEEFFLIDDMPCLLKDTPDYKMQYRCPFTDKYESDFNKTCNYEFEDCESCTSRSAVEYSGTFSDDTHIEYLEEQLWVRVIRQSDRVDLFTKYMYAYNYDKFVDMDTLVVE